MSHPLIFPAQLLAWGQYEMGIAYQTYESPHQRKLLVIASAYDPSEYGR